jgi:hypothetical protein
MYDYAVLTHLYRLDHFCASAAPSLVAVVVSKVEVDMLVVAVMLLLLVLLLPSKAPISHTLIVLSALHVTIAPGGSVPYIINTVITS